MKISKFVINPLVKEVPRLSIKLSYTTMVPTIHHRYYISRDKQQELHFLWTGVPEISTFDGRLIYYINHVCLGLLHSLDSPAVIWSDGEEDWYVNGAYITEEFQSWSTENSLPYWKDWTDNDKLLFRLRF